MAFCIMNVDKMHRSDVYGLQIEANRTKDDGRDFDNSDILKDLTDQNYHFKKTDSWGKEITKIIKEKGAKERSDSVVMLTGVYTASPEWFETFGNDPEKAKQYFKACYDFHVRTYCHGDESLMLNAVVHLDETTPHMQVASVPIVEDEKGCHLSAKILMGNRSDYELRQDKFFEEVGKPFDMERGKKKDPLERKTHLTKREWQERELETSVQSLEKMAENASYKLALVEAKEKEALESAAKAQEAADAFKSANENQKSANDALNAQNSVLQKRKVQLEAEVRRLESSVQQKSFNQLISDSQIKAQQQEINKLKAFIKSKGLSQEYTHFNRDGR